MDEQSTTLPLERHDVVAMICQIVSEIPGAPEKLDETTHLFGAKVFSIRSSWSMSCSTRSNRSTTTIISPSPSLMTAAFPRNAVRFAPSPR